MNETNLLQISHLTKPVILQSSDMFVRLLLYQFFLKKARNLITCYFKILEKKLQLTVSVKLNND